jgi:uncharacterized damage-inducible protein DinB
MRKLLHCLAVLGLAVALAPAAFAQAQRRSATMAKAPGLAESALQAWNDIGNKIIAMAQDFPADKYDYKPTPEVRTYAEILLHIAGADDIFTAAAQGRKPGPENLPRSEYNTKEKVVAAVTKAVRDGAAAIQAKGNKGMMETVRGFGGRPTTLLALCYDLIEHSGEHFGNLVTYDRLNGIVPPESRPQPRHGQ